MTSPKVDFLALLGVLEFTLILLVVALVFFIRSKNLMRQVRSLQDQLKVTSTVSEAVSFDQYLRDEVLRSQGLIDQAAASEDRQDRAAVELLSLRKKFLELELTAQEAKKNPVEFQSRVATGMHVLIEMLRPEPEAVVTEQSEAAPPQTGMETPAEETDPGRELHDTHDEELDHLRQVINNQQDAMAVLRAKLKEGSGDIGDIDSILAKLDDFEKQSRELHQCLEILEAENERLKAEKNSGDSPSVILQRADTEQLSGLKSMVDKQHETIASLHGLIKELAPDAQKAKQLEEAFAEIQSTNNELTGCVAVLEDENAMLREELEEIQAFLDKQEALNQAAAEDSTGQVAAATDASLRELEIKLQEMEALLEFKDAAIEELEKQYNKLQAKYLADTGKASID
jgi:DNA repair exonuclease SbcCD ATPase subunit